MRASPLTDAARRTNVAGPPDWLDMYGATKGLNIDQVARKVGLAPKTLYNARHATGRTRKTGKRKN